MITDKIKRGLNHYHTKLSAFFREKQFKAHGTRVKHMFFGAKHSDTLIVSFPACSPNQAKYNYMRTLLPYKCNKLFLLDDFGSNHQGCYLIEEHVEKCTTDLINSFIRKTKAKQLIFIGSSKGGYSALNFSFLISKVQVIIGAPQYFLGSYLDKKSTRCNLDFITNGGGKKDLDERLKHKIASSDIKPQHVYIHYSKAEHTFDEHIRFLLDDLKNAQVEVTEDIQDYPEHGCLSQYFPPYLVQTLNRILNEM